jgi:uncharacterized iron-regulated protein
MPYFRALLSLFFSWCAAASMLQMVTAHAAELPPLPAAEAPLDRSHPLVGQIVTSAGRLTPAQLIERAQGYDFVLLGEKHDNPDHHRLQAWVVDALVATGERPAIVMEMLDADQTEALADYRRRPGADAAGLGPALSWEARGWPSWSMYAPIAAVALRADLPILPANLTRADTRSIGRGERARLHPDVGATLEASPRYDAAQTESLTEELRESHCGQLPDAAVPRMVEVQWARDASMAGALHAGPEMSVLIAGTGHVRKDRAVPWHLDHRAPGRSVLSIALVEVQQDRNNPAAYSQSGLFDVLWFTARVDNEDPCLKFRDSLQRMRKP